MNYEKEIEELKKRIGLLENVLIKREENIEMVQAVSISKRDKTRYMYNNKIYPKNRLVLAIVSDYVKKNNPTFLQLQDIFDKSLQGSLNVVEELSNAELIRDGAKRYFMGEKDCLSLKDGRVVVVCTQWGIFNITKFIKLALSLGYRIETI